MEGKSSEGCRLDFWPSRILELPSDRSKAAVFVLAIAFGRVVFGEAVSLLYCTVIAKSVNRL